VGSRREFVLMGEGMIAGLGTALSRLDLAIYSSHHRDNVCDWRVVRRFQALTSYGIGERVPRE
jgi:hypothetical protein